MAITLGDLLAFNDVETTDILQGIVELPYVKPIAYVQEELTQQSLKILQKV